MPISFGSVGDIIAVCILAKDCVNALSETKGSSAAYQAVIRELYVLEKALLEVDLFCRTYSGSADLTALFESAKTTVEGCQKVLEGFKAKTKKYDTHLSDAASRSKTQKVFADTPMKLLWQIAVKDDVGRFRAEIVAYSVSINQLLATATM
jgi:hypothetical protein